MKESAQIALSVGARSRSKLGIDEELFEKRSFHVHVPAGAIPKDGPSAGITMATAVASLLTGRPVKHTVGMTGEITLQGRVLPIGGLKQKVLAPPCRGLTDIVIPERNRADLEDIPENVREEISFHPVMSIAEVLRPGARGGAGAAQCLGVSDHEPVPEDVRRAADVLERRYAVSILYASHHGLHGGSPELPPRRSAPSRPPTLAPASRRAREAQGVLRREVRDAPTAARRRHVLDDGGLEPVLSWTRSPYWASRLITKPSTRRLFRTEELDSFAASALGVAIALMTRTRVIRRCGLVRRRASSARSVCWPLPPPTADI
jgi:hypothetical protein